MKQFSLLEIISTATVLLAMVVESSGAFHVVGQATLQATHRCTPAPYGTPAVPAVLPTASPEHDIMWLANLSEVVSVHVKSCVNCVHAQCPFLQCFFNIHQTLYFEFNRDQSELPLNIFVHFTLNIVEAIDKRASVCHSEVSSKNRMLHVLTNGMSDWIVEETALNTEHWLFQPQCHSSMNLIWSWKFRESIKEHEFAQIFLSSLIVIHVF